MTFRLTDEEIVRLVWRLQPAADAWSYVPLVRSLARNKEVERTRRIWWLTPIAPKRVVAAAPKKTHIVVTSRGVSVRARQIASPPVPVVLPPSPPIPEARHLLEDVPADSPERVMVALDRRRVIAAAFGCMAPRLRRVLLLRYGLDGGGERTLAQVGRLMTPQISAARVSQLVQKAIRRAKWAYRYGALRGELAIRPWRLTP